MADRPYIMLGIESSCDETAAAIIGSDKTIFANEIASQMAKHAEYGGVVPEVAARAHLEAIDIVINQALQTAGIELADIDAFAATAGPGLIGGVAVGTVTAKALAAAHRFEMDAPAADAEALGKAVGVKLLEMAGGRDFLA